MDRQKKFEELVDIFIRITNRQNRLELIPKNFGTPQVLYKSEIHTVEIIGKNPESNMTEIADKLGVTKGALSQLVNKLKKKKLVIKERKANNEKEFFLQLTEDGKKAFENHLEHHQEHFNELFKEFNKFSDEQILFIEHVFKIIDANITRYLEDAGCNCFK